MMKRTLISAFAALLALFSCSKAAHTTSESVGSDAIMFAVSAPGLNVTRSEIRDDQAGQLADSVVTEKMGLRLHETLVEDFLYGHRLEPEALDGGGYTGRWFPAVPHGSEKYTWTDYLGKEMSFFAFAFSPFSKYGSQIQVTEGSRGRDVTIEQPRSYSGDFVDYMLSYQTNIPAQQAGGNFPLINIALEHAVAKVELYVECADAFVNNPDEFQIRFRGVTFNDIYTKARLSCTHHAVYGTQDENVWSVEYDRTATTDYSLSLDKNDGEPYYLLEAGGTEGPIKIMEFLAFPASANMPYSLSIEYDIIEKDGEDIKEKNSFAPAPFVLKNYTTLGWQSGHRVRYNLKIDNGIKLTGKVTDWVEMDYIEGVILPEIKEE